MAVRCSHAIDWPIRGWRDWRDLEWRRRHLFAEQHDHECDLYSWRSRDFGRQHDADVNFNGPAAAFAASECDHDHYNPR